MVWCIYRPTDLMDWCVVWCIYQPTDLMDWCVVWCIDRPTDLMDWGVVWCINRPTDLMDWCVVWCINQPTDLWHSQLWYQTCWCGWKEAGCWGLKAYGRTAQLKLIQCSSSVQYVLFMFGCIVWQGGYISKT